MDQQSIQTITAGCALLLVSLCMVTDLSRRRIPNVLTLPAIFVGLALGFAGAGWKGLVLSFLGILLGFALMILPYYLGGMGAGDVKLMAALGALAGFPAIFQVFLYTALAGGLVALLSIARKRAGMKALKNVFSMIQSFVLFRVWGATSQAGAAQPHKSVGAIPYGVAIAMGTYAYYLFGSIV